MCRNFLCQKLNFELYLSCVSSFCFISILTLSNHQTDIHQFMRLHLQYPPLHLSHLAPCLRHREFALSSLSHTSRSISRGPISISNASLIRSDVIPVLNILEILTTLEEYIIAIGGVVEGIALETEQARPAAKIGGIGLMPAPIARAAAIGQVITADAVLEAA